MIIGLTGQYTKVAAAAFYPNYVTVSFDDVLRDAALATFYISPQQPLDEIDHRYGQTPNAMIDYFVHTIIGDRLNDDHWLHLTAYKIQRLLNTHPGAAVVVTNIKGDKEAEMVHTLGGQIVAIGESKVNSQFIQHQLPLEETKEDLWRVLLAVVQH
jgi:hypothetical protein